MIEVADGQHRAFLIHNRIDGSAPSLCSRQIERQNPIRRAVRSQPDWTATEKCPSLELTFENTFTGDTDIFEPIRDSRSPGSKLWCLAGGILINSLLLVTIVLLSQVYAVRNATNRLIETLRKELGAYRVVAIIHEPARPKPSEPKRASQPVLPEPDERFLAQFHPRIVDFVRDNKALERILTQEFVRDINSRVLSVDKLLQKSSMRISFEVDENGNVARRRLLKSSSVPSVDHLFMELIKILEKYQILAPMKGLRRVIASLNVDDDIEIRVQGEALDEPAAADVYRQLQNMFTLTRFALGEVVAAELLDDISLVVEEKQVTVSKAFEKQPLIDFLLQYNLKDPRTPAQPELRKPPSGTRRPSG